MKFGLKHSGNAVLFFLAAGLTVLIFFLMGWLFRYQAPRPEEGKREHNSIYLMDISGNTPQMQKMRQYLSLYNPAEAVRSDSRINFAAFWKNPGRGKAVEPGMPEFEISLPPQTGKLEFKVSPPSPADILPELVYQATDEIDPAASGASSGGKGGNTADADKRQNGMPEVFLDGRKINPGSPPPRPGNVGNNGMNVRLALFRRNGIIRGDVLEGPAGNYGRLLLWAEKAVDKLIPQKGKVEINIIYPPQKKQPSGGKR